MALPDTNAPTSPVNVTDLAKTYHLDGRDVPALRGVDLSIESPGFYAIMGASGSGKSTLLHLMAGLDRPDRGSIVIEGLSLDAMSERELTEYRRHRVGMIFQQFNLIPTMTALDNVALPALLDGQRRRDVRNRAHELLDLLGMDARANHRPDALSGGEQQRVAIARALFFSPSILFADEPTGNLDSSASEQMWTLLRSLASERDMTVLMVTHEPDAAALCERVHVLRDGRMQGSFDVDGMDSTELAARTQYVGGAAR